MQAREVDSKASGLPSLMLKGLSEAGSARYVSSGSAGGEDSKAERRRNMSELPATFSPESIPQKSTQEPPSAPMPRALSLIVWKEAPKHESLV